MNHRWFTPLAIAGVTTLLVGSGVAQTTGSGTSAPATTPGASSPATTNPQPSASSPSAGTTGKTMPGATQSDTTQPGQVGSGSMATGSKKSSVMNGQATSEQVKSLQQSLQDKGMDPGPIDGVMGPRTQAALRAFQKDQNLPQTGRTDPQTLEKLGVGR